MRNRMQEAVDILMEKFEDNAAILITYMRGATTIATGVRTTVGRTPYEVQEGEVWVAYECRDYIFDKKCLILAGVQYAPMSGDKIIEADGLVYEVSTLRPNYAFESIGPAGRVFKVHTTGPR